MHGATINVLNLILREKLAASVLSDTSKPVLFLFRASQNTMFFSDISRSILIWGVSCVWHRSWNKAAETFQGFPSCLTCSSDVHVLTNHISIISLHDHIEIFKSATSDFASYVVQDGLVSNVYLSRPNLVLGCRRDLDWPITLRNIPKQ